MRIGPGRRERGGPGWCRLSIDNPQTMVCEQNHRSACRGLRAKFAWLVATAQHQRPPTPRQRTADSGSRRRRPHDALCPALRNVLHLCQQQLPQGRQAVDHLSKPMAMSKRKDSGKHGSTQDGCSDEGDRQPVAASSMRGARTGGSSHRTKPAMTATNRPATLTADLLSSKGAGATSPTARSPSNTCLWSFVCCPSFVPRASSQMRTEDSLTARTVRTAQQGRRG